MFWHGERELRIMVHGAGFTVLGAVQGLGWFRKAIGEKYPVKFRGSLGPGQEDDADIMILNRMAEWTPAGVRYEVGHRHADITLHHLGLKHGSKAVWGARHEG